MGKFVSKMTVAYRYTFRAYLYTKEDARWKNDIIVENFMHINSHYLAKCASIFIKVKNIDGSPYVRMNLYYSLCFTCTIIPFVNFMDNVMKF